jgi:UDP-N-acetylglucosamine acyltransferase
MANKIESTAIIEDGAELGDNNYIGHFTVIRKNTRIGNNNFIGNHTVIGELCQHSVNKHELNGFKLEDQHKREVIIGSNNVIREFTTVHLPTSTNSTIISDNCYLMAYNHISHDTILRNNVILANNIQIGGHTIIEEYVNIGLSTIIHQRSTIGAFCMLGMGSIITKDIPPFLTVIGTPVKEGKKLNEWGLKRYGLESCIEEIKAYYQSPNASLALLSDEITQFITSFELASRREKIIINILAK